MVVLNLTLKSKANADLLIKKNKSGLRLDWAECDKWKKREGNGMETLPFPAFSWNISHAACR